MKHLNTFLGFLIVMCVLMVWSNPLPAATLDELIAGAKKEGSIELYSPSQLTNRGAQELAEAFNRKYGLKIKMYFSPSGSMTRDVGKLIGMAATGVAPEWDLFVATDSHHGRLWLKKLHEPFDYANLGVDPNLITYDKGVVSIAHMFILPAYNKKILPAEDFPKSWEDLLNPKWKGGKLGMASSVHHLARLAVGPWGEEKATQYVKGIAAQEPILGKLGEMYNRLLIGEIQVSVTLIDTFIRRAEKKGAPLSLAEGIEPVISAQFMGGVPKGAEHPNVAYLFIAFLTTPEAQNIWEKYTGVSSAFIPGTKAYKYVQGKQVVYMNQDQVNDVTRLSKEYGKILGFRKK